MTPGIFLTAEWRSLLMLNFECDSELLTPYLPAGTELDNWHGSTLISLVGFRFLETCLCGWTIPWHRDFDEVNLRFYVRRKAPEGTRRGVVFIKEIVPRRAVAWVARTVYGENYMRLPMRSQQRLPVERELGKISYEWRTQGAWHGLYATMQGPAEELVQGSAAEFITEHYWGYTRQPDGSALEYQVEHPRWRVWATTSAEFQGDPGAVYPQPLAEMLRRPPVSALVAEGSPVIVRRGVPIRC